MRCARMISTCLNSLTRFDPFAIIRRTRPRLLLFNDSASARPLADCSISTAPGWWRVIHALHLLFQGLEAALLTPLINETMTAVPGTPYLNDTETISRSSLHAGVNAHHARRLRRGKKTKAQEVIRRN